MSGQLYTFFLLVLTGALLAFLFDCYRVVRNAAKLKWFMTALSDLFYWLIATAVVFLALLEGNWGEVRFYAILGLLSGAGVYYKLLSRYTIALLYYVINLFRKTLFVLRLIVQGIIKPVLFPLRWLWRVGLSGARRSRNWLQEKLKKPPE